MKPTRVALWLAAWLLTSACGLARAGVRDSFESAETSWGVIHRDCTYRLEEHQRTFKEAHTGAASEYVRVAASQGTRVYFAQRVAAARVIEELTPSLWIKADRAGLQLLARVVLPRTIDPLTDEPLTVFVDGDIYDQPGTWRELRIENLKQRLDQQVRVLRQNRKGLRIDPLEAYIDHVVVNIHPGSGVANVWLDDLNLSGFATSSQPTQVALAGYNDVQPGSSARPPNDARTTSAPVRVRGSLLMVDERPFFARAIDYHGEPLAWLGSLGFNTVLFAAPPTADQQREAARLGLWLVVPGWTANADQPPSRAAAGPQPLAADPQPIALGTPHGMSTERVLALHAGAGLTARDLLAVRTATRRVRASGSAIPILAEVESGASVLANEVDLIVHHRAILGTSNELSKFGDWLEHQHAQVRREQPFWATIPVDPAAQQFEQLVLLGANAQAAAAAIEPEQLRLLVYHAVAAGARGLVFKSMTRLDGADPAARRRANTLRILNQELAAIEPWATAGAAAGRVSSSEPLMRTRLLKTERARLLIATRSGAQQQFVVGPYPADQTVAFDVGALPITDQAYRVQFGDLRPLHGRNAGSALQCDNVGLITVILMTQDPLAINHLARTLGESRAAAAQLHQQTVELQLAATSELLAQLAARGQTVPGSQIAMSEAEYYRDRARQLLDTGDHASGWLFGERAANRVRGVRQAAWRQTAINFPSPVASPLCLGCETLPAHFDLAQRGLRWGANVLPAGDFEDLTHLTRSGWRHERDVEPGIAAAVDLSASDSRSGRSALHIRVQAPGGAASAGHTGLGDRWPVTITSAPIAVRNGRVLQIHGWVKIPNEIIGSDDGLLIYDTMTGLPLAERITATRGWQEFTLYRAAPRDGALSIILAMTGLGEAWIDDVTVTLAEP